MTNLLPYFPQVLGGVWLTASLALCSLVLTAFLGAVAAAAKVSRSRFLAAVADAYTSIVRGLPELVLMLLIYFGGQMLLNDLGEMTGWWERLELGAFASAVLALGFVFGSYVAETFRGAYLAILMLMLIVFSSSFVIALPLAVLRAYEVAGVRWVIHGYTRVVRGTPLLVQVYIIYYGLGQFGFIRETPLWVVLSEALYCLVLGLILNNTAYLVEILRGAIREVPTGIVEACKSIGMSPAQTLVLVVLPIAIRRSLPVLANEIIFVMHATAVASTITIVDILGAGRALNGTYYVAYEGFITAAVLYILIAYSISWLFRRLERRYLAPLAMS